MAMARQIEPPGPPPLGNPSHIKHSPHQIRQSHDRFISQRHIPVRVIPVSHKRMHCRDQAEQAHAQKERNPERTTFSRGEGRGEKRDDRARAHDCDDGEIDDLPMRGAEENVVYGREEGGDDHDGDPGVVHTEEMRV